MTDKELTIWEHLDSVIRILTCKEMGAWLHRRDKRVLVAELEKIKAEILKDYPYAENDNKASLTLHGIYLSLQYLDKHIDELKGE